MQRLMSYKCDLDCYPLFNEFIHATFYTSQPVRTGREHLENDGFLWNLYQNNGTIVRLCRILSQNMTHALNQSKKVVPTADCEGDMCL